MKTLIETETTPLFWIYIDYALTTATHFNIYVFYVVNGSPCVVDA